MNPLQIDGKQTYLVELSYTCYGERYAYYCLILDRKPKPICFRLDCRESDYQGAAPGVSSQPLHLAKSLGPDAVRNRFFFCPAAGCSRSR
jgi:hypothetical protein